MTHCKPGYFEREAGHVVDSLGIGLAGWLGGPGLIDCTQPMGSRFEELGDSLIEELGDSLIEQVGDRLIELEDSLFELVDSLLELEDSPFEKLGDSQFVDNPD